MANDYAIRRLRMRTNQMKRDAPLLAAARRCLDDLRA